MTAPPAKASAAMRTALGGVTLWLGFFAGWTLASVPLVLACAPFPALWLAFGLALASAALAYWWLRPRLEDTLLAPGPLPDKVPWPLGWRRLMWGAGLLALALAGVLFIPTSNAIPFWVIAVLLGLAGLTEQGGATAKGTALPAAAGGWIGLVLLSLVVLALYFVILRPDADDAFYLNLPIGLIAQQGCMMGWDTMYGAENWPILGSNYRVEALPTQVAALASATGLPVVTVAHGLLPAVWCLVWAATLAVIGHGLFGYRWWVFAVFALLSSMVFAGTLQSWGVHGISRLFHGKGPLLLIVFPLIGYLVARSAAIGTALAPVVAALFGLSTIALGLTANAIYLAPLTVLVSVLAAHLVWRRGMWRGLCQIAASAAPVLAGLWLLLLDTPVTADEPDGLTRAADLAFWGMADSKITLALFMATLAAALVAVRFGPAGRWITAFLVGFLLLVLNPLLWPIYDRFVTGGLSFRLWWALPLPIFLAIALTWAVLHSRRLVPVAALATSALAALIALPSGLVGMNGTMLRPSIHKLPPEIIPVLEDVWAAAPTDGTVLAPEEIATWLATRAGHPALVYTRELYFAHSAQVVTTERLSPRVRLADWISGRGSGPNGTLSADLAALEVRLVVLPGDAASAPLAAELEALGAQGEDTRGGYRIYRFPANR